VTGLATQAELVKLSTVLGVDTGELDFLSDIEAEPLRVLRDAITAHLVEEDQPLFRRLAQIVDRMPSSVAILLARYVGPIIAAGVIVEIPARRAAALAMRAPSEFLADACAYVDPRKARDMISLLPIEKVVDVALVLDSREDFVTMSRFVDFISDEAIVAVEEAIPDEGRLLRIAFLMESKNRVDHIFRMLPNERVQRMLARVQEDPNALLAEFLSLLVHVSYSFKRELGDIVAGQSEELLNAYILGAHEQHLWSDVLPVVAAMSPVSRQRVVNLPLLREHAVQLRLLQTADQCDQWGLVLPLIGLMADHGRQAVAMIMNEMAGAVLADAVDAALTGEHWDVLVDVVVRMNEHRQAEYDEIIARIATVDPHLGARVQSLTTAARGARVAPAATIVEAVTASA
jgi:hypothetical protein